MKIIGIILIIFGGLWIFSRLLNQPKMLEIIGRQIIENGLIFGIKRYLISESFGLGLGIGIVWIGFYLYNPTLLSFFASGVCILLSLIFLWAGFKLNILPHVLIFLLSINGLLLWGLNGLIGGFIIGWLLVILIGIFVIIINKFFNIEQKQKK